MSLELLERRGARALRQCFAAGDERGLLEAYEFGRAALAENLGVLEMALLLSRIVASLPASRQPKPSTTQIESFLLESLTPFEMAHRGAREANEALRRIDERREEHVRQIARELHDEAGQLVAGVCLSLDALRPHVASRGGEHLARAQSLLEGVADELRRVAHELRPTILDDLGLVPALRSLADSVAKRSGVKVTVSGSVGGRLPAPVETAVFRTAQEALNNVVRHARASRAVIEVHHNRNEVRWEVRDDGRGFDPEALGRPGASGGMGLRGIRERIAPLGGAVEIRSRPGGGTALLVRVPLEVSHAHSRPAGG